MGGRGQALRREARVTIIMEFGALGGRMLRRACQAGLVLLLVLGFGARNEACAQASDQSGESRLSATLDRLWINIPLPVVMRPHIYKSLDELVREPCDRKAIVSLGEVLRKDGYRREAANAHVRFSETCQGGHPQSLQVATNILLDLSDYATAAAVATMYIALLPFDNNGYFLRAVAHDRGGEPRKAIDDYITAIELFGDKSKISSVGYIGLARNYDRIGQFCDAALTIQTWIALNPARNETSQTRTMIVGYMAKGGCAVEEKRNEVVIPITRRGDVVTVSVVVNGVTGNFIVDTGATFVMLTHGFAQKASADVDQNSIIKITTANGVADAKRGRAKTIRLRTLESKDVPIVVHANPKETFGGRYDGLLGMSFLSRFNVSMDAKSVRIRARTGH
jgi:clan AA aspartic protease (TIGR02281 family)